MVRNVRETHEKYYRNPEFAADYLNLALDSDDPRDLLHSLRLVVEAQAAGIGGVACSSGLSTDEVYFMLSNEGNITATGFTQLMGGLGLQLEVSLKTAGG